MNLQVTNKYSPKKVTFQENISRVFISFLKGLRRSAIDISYYFADTLINCILNPQKCESISKKTLCIIRLDAIGDFVLWTSALSEYEKKYPKNDWHWILIGSKEWSQLACLVNVFDQILELDRKSFSRDVVYRYKKISNLKKLNVDILLHPTHSRTFIFSEAVVRAIDAPIKIGSGGDLSNMQKLQSYISKKWYTNLLYCKSGIQMELERHLEFINNLGIPSLEISAPSITLNEVSVADALHEYNLNHINKYFVIFPGASWSGKRWPLERYLIVSKKIYEKYGWHCVVLGGGYEQDIIKNVEKNQNGNLTSLIGKTDLLGFLSVISQAKLVISNDTAAAHFAAAVKTPAITIVGGGHFGRFFPYKLNGRYIQNTPSVIHSARPCFNCNWQCHYSFKSGDPVPCISDISEEMVMKQVRLISEKEKVS